MSITKSLVAVLAGVVVLAGCGGPLLPSTAERGSESRPVSGVTALTLAATGTVEVTTGATESLTIEAPRDVLPDLTSDVAGGMLTLGSRADRQRDVDGVVYRLTVPTLDRVVLDGSGEVRYPDLQTPRLAVEITGSGDVELGGTVEAQTATIEGSGDYRADALASRTAEVTITGSGEATVQVADRLRAVIEGSGDIRYRGSPQVERTVTGSGEIAPA